MANEKNNQGPDYEARIQSWREIQEELAGDLLSKDKEHNPYESETSLLMRGQVLPRRYLELMKSGLFDFNPHFIGIGTGMEPEHTQTVQELLEKADTPSIVHLYDPGYVSLLVRLVATQRFAIVTPGFEQTLEVKAEDEQRKKVYMRELENKLNLIFHSEGFPDLALPQGLTGLHLALFHVLNYVDVADFDALLADPAIDSVALVDRPNRGSEQSEKLMDRNRFSSIQELITLGTKHNFSLLERLDTQTAGGDISGLLLVRATTTDQQQWIEGNFSHHTRESIALRRIRRQGP